MIDSFKNCKLQLANFEVQKLTKKINLTHRLLETKHLFVLLNGRDYLNQTIRTSCCITYIIQNAPSSTASSLRDETTKTNWH